MSPSATVGPIQKTCPYCLKSGLPILPLRYAVARSDMGHAPELAAPFGAGVESIKLPEKQAHYTLRLLRAGYLYVYDERYGKRGWSAYQVDEGGYLFPFDPYVEPPASGYAKQHFSCSRNGNDPYIARCFTVNDAAKATQIWLGFSDVLWTPSVLDAHASPAYRDAHMRRIDVAAVRAGANQPHAAKLAGLAGRLAEYATTPAALHGPTAAYVKKYLPTPFTDPHQLLGNTAETRLALQMWSGLLRSLWPASVASASALPAAGRVQSAAWAFSGSPLFADHALAVDMEKWAADAAKPYHPGMVALDDPAGITLELNGLIQQLTAEFAEEPQRKWKHETALMLQTLERRIKEGAVKQAEGMVDILARMDAVSAAEANRRTGGLMASNYDYAKDRAALAKAATHAGDAEWDNKYAPLIASQSAVNEALNQFPADWAEYAENVELAALDESFVNWASSAAFQHYFTHNFDRKSLPSGAVYAEVMGAIVGGLGGRPNIVKFLAQALAASPSEPEHVIARAQAANHDALIADWVASAQQADTRIQGELVVATAAELYGRWRKLLAGNPQQYQGLAKFAYQASAPWIKVLNDTGAKGAQELLQHLPARRVLGALGALAKLENPNLVLADMRGTLNAAERSRVLEHSISQILGVGGGQYRPAARHIVKSKNIDVDALVLVDESALARASAAKGGRTLGTAAIAGTVSVQTLDDAIAGTAPRLGKAGTGAVLGTVGLFLSVWNCKMLLADVGAAKGSTALDQAEANLVAQGTSMVSGSFEAAAKVLDPYHATRMGAAFGRYSAQRAQVSDWLTRGGRIVGGISGIIVGGVAIWQGMDDYTAGHEAVGDAEFYLGAVSVVGGVLVVVGATGIGIPLVIIAGLLLLLVACFKQNPVQDWIENCKLGTHKLTGTYKGLVPQQLALATL